MESRHLSLLNTRAFKVAENHFIISFGSISNSSTERGIVFKDSTFDLEYGEFSGFLSQMNTYFAKALNYTANEHQVKMLVEYMKHFLTGDIEDHKNSQRAWIKDKGPSIENNIGWIEKYDDPQNLRAIFQGWVAMVDK